MERRDDFERDEILSRSVKAGKRTYFFDVKQTRNNDKYLVITESKKMFNDNDGTFSYEKHKIFLYKEDYDKFSEMFNAMINYIKGGEEPPQSEYNRDSDDFSDNFKY